MDTTPSIGKKLQQLNMGSRHPYLTYPTLHSPKPTLYLLANT
jgi:hypothetical protein